ncbi:MAG TPA: GTP 3',8-cyclase MoaA [Verrucomicrobiota bacterium]|nr:GTP 3',8-cyclase MoaA [Verrucomicrobiota bacterium]
MTRDGALVDSHGRTLRDLRVSLTDRCNFRCLYCLPETEAAQNFYRGHWAKMPNPAPIGRQWLPRAEILSFEEIERVIRVAAQLGIHKIRLTGGEPLLRNDIEKLVARIASIPGVDDLAMTTNGFLFPQKARALRDAGLRRVSFSLDSLDRDNFKKITGRDGLDALLESIALAQQLGFHPVKVNAVIIREINDHEIEALAGFARERNISLRFIEFMPLDSARAWQKEMVITGGEILSRLKSSFKLRPVSGDNPSSTSRRWAFEDGRGEIGIIAPVSEPFCGHCNRLRLTADGKIRTCLFSVTEHDLRPVLRNGASDNDLANWFHAVALQKEARHHIGEPDFVQPPRSMSCIGG